MVCLDRLSLQAFRKHTATGTTHNECSVVWCKASEHLESATADSKAAHTLNAGLCRYDCLMAAYTSTPFISFPFPSHRSSFSVPIFKYK